jgi:transposase
VKKKIRYRSVGVESIDAGQLAEKLPAARCIVAIDIAKEAMVAGFANERGECQALVRFSHPKQTLVFLALLVALRELGRTIEVAMEPTGVYGESLRHQLGKRELPVFRVDPTRSHALASVLDGVPSLHDAKSCTLIAHLHAQGISSRWKEKSTEERAMRALIDEHGLHQSPLERGRGQMEAVLAEYFPELGEMISHSCTWHLHLLQEFPSPAQIAAAPDAVASLLRRVARGHLSQEKIERIVSLAQSSLGASMLEDEGRQVSALARTLLYHREQQREVEKRIRQKMNQRADLAQLLELLGPVTTAAIVADLGHPAHYGSSAAFEKAVGLNLKEKSSGKHQGQLRITKRGSPRVRRYLFLAALRLIQWDPIVCAWYRARISYKAGVKLKAVVAVMRKLARAIVHVARGQRFEAPRLFDVRRLELPHQEPLHDEEDSIPEIEEPNRTSLAVP